NSERNLSIFSFFFFSSRRRHTRFSRDWSSDVCSSDLFVDQAAEARVVRRIAKEHPAGGHVPEGEGLGREVSGGLEVGASGVCIKIGRASCRERVEIAGVAVAVKMKEKTKGSGEAS